MKIYCINCNEYILDAEKLEFPLVGNMFTHRPDVEWDVFSEVDTGLDLVCPMCEWTFYDLTEDSAKILTDKGIVAVKRLTGVEDCGIIDTVAPETKRRGRPKGSKNVKKRVKRGRK